MKGHTIDTINDCGCNYQHPGNSFSHDPATHGVQHQHQHQASIPLLPSMNDTESTSLNSGSTSQTNMSLADVITTSLLWVAVAVHVASHSSSPPCFADDLILGVNFLDPEQCIQRFKPQDLPLFDLKLLADAVHDKAPIYSLFANQCYWFVNIIFEIVVQLYTLSAASCHLAGTLNPSGPYSIPSPSPNPAPTSEIDAPKNANLLILPTSEEAGQWYGILISDSTIRQTVMHTITSDFKEQLEYFYQVSFH